MIYTYKKVSSEFEKVHTYIEHLVLQVWCRPTAKYSISLLHPEFIPIVTGVRNKNILVNPIREIYGIFKTLYKNDRRGFNKLRNGFINNNSIEELCKGKVTPLLYSEVKKINASLETKLKLFFKNFYTEVPKSVAFKKVCGDMKTYYDKFLDLNSAEICPFCGITDIMTSRLSKRDAFDHYLPKDIYPFNSVNPVNLAPICKTCNSSYKLANSPILDKKGKGRKAFYPFAKTIAKLNISVSFNSSNIDKLKKNQVVIGISNKAYQEQIDTWMDLFGIKERYIDKFCSKDAKWWRVQLLDELRNSKKTKTKRFAEKIQLFENNYLDEKNFLKIPYLKACHKLGFI